MTRAEAIRRETQLRRFYPEALAQKRTDNPGSAWMVTSSSRTGRTLPQLHLNSESRKAAS
jgi:hypothetical protein